MSNKLFNELVSGSERALSKALTLLESKEAKSFKEKLLEVAPKTKTKVIGITGYPGAGKSTLINALISKLHKPDEKIAVLAVDPTSPITGGALLGDRIRMQEVQSHEGVFLRSFASRGALGGLTGAIEPAILACSHAGYRYLILETVGVGQSEVDIAKLADPVVVVLVPGMGDSVQSLKAGVLEIADIFVINKSDHSGADALKKDLLEMMSLSSDPKEIPIVMTVASKKEGIEELIAEI